MFNRTILVAPDRTENHHHRTEVHEHRAPTDESVRLLSQMEQKMRDRVLSAIHVANTPVEFALYHLRSTIGLDTEFAIRCSINGTNLEIRHPFRIKLSESKEQARERCVDELTQALATQIAGVIVRAALVRALRENPIRLT